MKKIAILGAMTVAGLSAGVASAATLDDVKARGKLNCGVTTGLVGFAAPNANGEWEGFDVGVCRAVAAAVLGDPTAVEFVPTTGKTRFTASVTGRLWSREKAKTKPMAKPFEWPAGFSPVILFANEGVADFSGHRVLSRTGVMLPSVVGAVAATLCQVQERFPRAYLSGALR